MCHLLLLLLIPSSLCRILESRDPKVDPLSLDNVVSKIVDSTMDDLRFRLRQAIYALALRQSEVPPQNLDKYEDWLLQEFISQMRKQSDPEEANGYQMPEASSHTMSIALETHTLNPLLVQRDKKLVTAADLRMMDAVDQPLLLSRNPIPLWALLLTVSCLTVFFFIICTALCIRRRRKKTRVRLPRLPDPFTISAIGLSQNGPGAFLDRLRETERDGESLWTMAPSMESVRPL